MGFLLLYIFKTCKILLYICYTCSVEIIQL